MRLSHQTRYEIEIKAVEQPAHQCRGDDLRDEALPLAGLTVSEEEDGEGEEVEP